MTEAWRKCQQVSGAYLKTIKSRNSPNQKPVFALSPFLKPFDRVLGKPACPNNCWMARMEENYLDNSSKLLSNLDNSAAKLLSNFLDEKLLS